MKNSVQHYVARTAVVLSPLVLMAYLSSASLVSAEEQTASFESPVEQVQPSQSSQVEPASQQPSNIKEENVAPNELSQAGAVPKESGQSLQSASQQASTPGDSARKVEKVAQATASSPQAAPQANQKQTTVTVGEIQGAGHRSPYANKEVTVQNVVVTYVPNEKEFYVQDLTPDSNSKTSDGMLVYAKNHHVMVGDKLKLTGRVTERYGNGYAEKAKTDLSITQLNAKTIVKEGMARVPGPIVLGVDRVAPNKVVDDDAMTSFNPDTDGLDFWESLEGMLVSVNKPRVLGPQSNKEVYVVPQEDKTATNKAGGITIEKDNVHPNKIAVLFDKSLVVKTGDSFAGTITGPISYSYTNYKLLAKKAEAPALVDGGVKPEVTALVKDPNKLSIASYNIENFSANTTSTTKEKVERIARSFVEDLKAPDIVTLIEVQDNNGATDDGTVDASQSAQRLIDAIKALGGPAYRYVDVTPINNQDGGQPGSNIRTGFLYNPERVSLSDKPKGDATTAAAWENGELKYSVARIDPTNVVWKDSRKPLIAEFNFQGQKMNVVAVHLNSKRGDDGLFGQVQPPVFKSEVQRHQMATVINQFIEAGMKQNPNLNVAMLGDYNDYEFTKTLEIIAGKSLSNLVSRHDKADRFSYFYQGNNQSLDNIVLSNNLLNRYEFDMVHVNSIFMKEHGRASDHDPLLLQVDLRPQTEESSEAPSLKLPEDKENHKSVPASGLSPADSKGQLVKRTVAQNQKVKGQTLPQTGDSSRATWLGAMILTLMSLPFFKRQKSED